MSKERKRKGRKTWSKEETEALLDFFAAPETEFDHSRKKKHGYEHLLEDMLSAGFADSQTTVSHLEAKMQTLLRAYKAAKDNNNRTGAAPCLAPFLERMHELFGKKPTITNVHNVTVGVDAIEIPTEMEALPEPEMYNNVSLPAEFSDSELEIFLSPELPQSSDARHSPDTEFEFFLPPEHPQSTHGRHSAFPPQIPMPVEILPSATPTTANATTRNSSRRRKKNITRSMYFEKKLEEKENQRKEKNQKWVEYVKIGKEKQKTRNLKLELLKEYIKNKT